MKIANTDDSTMDTVLVKLSMLSWSEWDATRRVNPFGNYTWKVYKQKFDNTYVAIGISIESSSTLWVLSCCTARSGASILETAA